MKTIQRLALVLVIIGALNWGLIGFFQFDLVATIFGGQDAFLSRLIYGLVGISGIVCIGLLLALMEKEEHQESHRGIHNAKYATEFGEETDLSEYREKDEK